MKPQSEHPLFAEERKGQILELLRQKSKLLVPELCDYFDVSPATIRNDLRDLENERKLKRTHGGAISLEKTPLSWIPDIRKSGIWSRNGKSPPVPQS